MKATDSSLGSSSQEYEDAFEEMPQLSVEHDSSGSDIGDKETKLRRSKRLRRGKYQ